MFDPRYETVLNRFAKDLHQAIDADDRKEWLAEMRLEKMEGEFARNQDMAQRDLEQRLAKAADTTMLLRKGMEQEIGLVLV